MKKPQTLRMSFPSNLLDDWRKKRRGMLKASDACDYLKKILTLKAARRTGSRRFFGEAYVATRIKHRRGFYGSFKWLTNAQFAQDRPFPNGPTKEFKEELRAALLKHFSKGQLDRLRTKAQDYQKRTGVKPVAPDLWLIDRQGNHRFIEVKLPGDCTRPAQDAGMALIKSCLRPRTRLSVEVADLCPERISDPRAKASRKAGWHAVAPLSLPQIMIPAILLKFRPGA